ncbi:hypothetical protein [Gulosibacter bifidus]|uniref:Uncharacterized protein n=1 Tax=Gulosibacter bifidus TaxID=272239 RepID=A0ABW5RIS7_9MICO|nr:hypothetical protein [Gulosibacter bifidus]
MSTSAGKLSEEARLQSELRAAQLTVRQLQQRIDRLERRVAAEQASAAMFANQVKELRASRSWQLTLPVRAGMRAMRAVRGRRG